jgi:uncharacterized protein YbjT (DUF2867 family)
MIVITTPTGDIGSQVLQRVVKGSEPVRVIARNPSRLPQAIRTHVQVVEGSHGDAATIQRALQGADSLFWLVPPEPLMKLENIEEAYADFTKPAAEAILACGLKRVVSISGIARGWSHAGLATANLKADGVLAVTGVALRALVMPSFMENLLRQASSIKEKGTFSLPSRADLKTPLVATADIAAVAAKFLIDTSWSGQAEVPVLGPEDISPNEMAEILSEVLSRPVRYEQTPVESYKNRIAKRGMSEAFAQGLADMMAAKNEGLDNTADRAIAADTPTTFRQWSEAALKPIFISWS